MVKDKATVVVVGGGATGVGILRDLSMRGIDALLIEKLDMVNGASSRYHGLLHSGARYAVRDQEAAKECIEENTILRRIGKSCVEATTGMFVQVEGDDPDFVEPWLKGCAESGISTRELSKEEALRLEPNLSRKLKVAYEVPDGAIDGFRMSWQNLQSAARYGGRYKTYTELIKVNIENATVKSITVRDNVTKEEYDIECEILVNAAGPWAGKVAELAGLECNVSPSKGTLIAFNQRITNHVVNRLRKPSNGDIFVPHGSITILGTSSITIPDPEDTSTSWEEVEDLMKTGVGVFEHLRDYRILRVFAGSRPLYVPKGAEGGRNASRGFVTIDHEKEDGLKGMMTICGGKFTTYRLMAEKFCDVLAPKLHNTAKCRTAEEDLVPEVPEAEKKAARQYFPSYGVNLAATRLGVEKFGDVVKTLKEQPETREVLCECENVTMAEIQRIAAEPTSHCVADVRRRTRLGMGTCQGNYCAIRSAAVANKLFKNKVEGCSDSLSDMKNFLQARWKGITPVMAGKTLREAEMTRGMYELLFNVNGGRRG